MRKFRLLLLPLGVAAELIILAACRVIAVAQPDNAKSLMRWATRTLPTLNWYIGE